MLIESGTLSPVATTSLDPSRLKINLVTRPSTSVSASCSCVRASSRRMKPSPPTASVSPSGPYARLSTYAGHRRLSADPRVRPGVEEEKSVAEAANRERPAVAADLDRAEELGSAVHDPVRFRRAQEGLRADSSGSAANGRSRPPDGRAGASGRGHPRRAPGRRGAGRAARSPRRAPRRAGRRRRSRPRRPRRAGPRPRRAARAGGGSCGGLALVSCSEASRLSVTKSRSSSLSSKRVVGAPVECGGEACAAVELALIAPGRVPFGRRLGDVAAQPASFGVLLDPLAQARPLAQQRLVGDLDGAFRRR